MVSRDMLRREIMDIFNESEETDQEYLTIPLCDAVPFEDLHTEIDIERYYRKISNVKIKGSNPGMQYREHTKSEHVQTDPDIANVPASWLLEGGKLIEELYTGIGNIINVIYHSPESYTTANVGRESVIDPKGMKYFKYDNGYWQSTLLPNIKIPDRNLGPLSSEDVKTKLHSLLDVATKLKNIVPYVTNVELPQNPRIVEDEVQFRSSKTSSRDFKRKRLPPLCARPSKPIDCDMDLSNDSFETCSDSGKSSNCSPEYGDTENHETERVLKENYMETVSERNAVQDESRGFDQIPGVQVSKYTLKKRARSLECTQNSEPGVSNGLRSRENGANAMNSKRSGLCIVEKSVPGIAKATNNVTASCSNDSKFGNKNNKVESDYKATQRREKHVFYGQENHPKSKPNSGSQVNFIRRNIMATKNKANRVGSIAGSNERCYNSETRKIRSSLR